MLAQCRFWVPPKGYASAGMRITCGIDNTVLYTKWLKLLSLKTTTNDYWLLVNGWYLFHIPHPIIKIHQCCVPQSVMLACAIGVYEKIPSSSQINISNCYTLTLFVFVFQFVNVVYYIDWLADIEESLHPWDRWMKLEPIIQSEVSQKEKHKIQYTNAYIWNLERW